MPDNAPVEIQDERYLDVGGVRYLLLDDFADATHEIPFVVKSPAMMQRYLDVFQRVRPQRIVELGIFKGTSTAVFAELSPGARVVAFELAAEPPSFLTDYIEDHGAHDRIRPYYGVDQADRGRLTEILDAEFGDEPLDLVVDDASHLLGPTRASFDVLFPRLRPGGIYSLEDWECDQRFAAIAGAELAKMDADLVSEIVAQQAERAARRPLIDLAMELVVTVGTSPDVVSGMTINEFTIMIERGPADLDRASFALRDHYHDQFGLLADPS